MDRRRRAGSPTDPRVGGGLARRPRGARVLAVVAGALLGVLLGLAGPSAAQAHADLVGSAPANGEHLDVAPAEIRLRFSERVSLAGEGVTVTDVSGARRSAEPARILPGDGTDVTLALPSDLGDGVYTVSWRITSSDSHPLRGAFVFSVGRAEAASLASSGTGTDPALATAFWVTRVLGYAGLALLGGGFVFLVLCWPRGWSWPPVRRLLTVAWAASLVAAGAALMLQGPYGASASLARLADPDLIAATLDSDYGAYVLARLVVLLIAGPLLWIHLRRTRSGQDPAPELFIVGLVLLGVVLPATWTGTGHAHAQPGLLPPLVDTAHLAAMAVWIGGLAFLVIGVLPGSAAHPVGEVAVALTRFSRVAAAAVATLALTGLYQAWRGLGSWSALPGSSYGTLLVVKLGLIGLLLWFGAISRSATRRRYLSPTADTAAPTRAGRTQRRAAKAEQEQDRAARRYLRRSVGAEAALAVSVLAVTSLLVATPPGARSTGTPVRLASAYVTELQLDGGGRIRAEIDPPRVGSTRLMVAVWDADGRLWDVPEVSGELILSGDQLGPLRLSLTRRSPGSYAADALVLPRNGTWRLRLTVRTSDVDTASVATEFTVS